MSLSDWVDLVRGVYICTNNTDRHRFVERLMKWEKELPQTSIIPIGLGLLRVTNEGSAVQAYGAVLLRRALSTRQITPTDLPTMELLLWYCNEPSLDRLLCHDLTELLIECAIYSPHSTVVAIFSTLCEDTAAQPRRMLLLAALVVALLVPDFQRIPRDLIGRLKTGVVQLGAKLLQVTTMALYSYFIASGGEQAVILAPQTEDCVEGAFNVITALGPMVPLKVWTEVGLESTMVALLQWKPASRHAITCTTALLRSHDGGQVEREAVLRHLLATVLAMVPFLVSARDISTIDEILTLLPELPKDLLQAGGTTLVQGLLQILGIPSIQFAQQACSLMERVDDETYRRVYPHDIYSALRSRLTKNECHPSTGTNPEGVELSVDQFGFDRLFEEVFADFRRSASAVLTKIAQLFPELTNQYVLRLLQDLPDPRGTDSDPRTSEGYVQQSSATFAAWEVTQFMMEHLSISFTSSTAYVSECIEALLRLETSDAVLCPVFFNMMSNFWKCPDDPSLNIWQGTLTILFNCVKDSRWINVSNVDVVAARRRAHTLLVKVTSEYSKKYIHLIPSFLKQLESLIVVSSGAERSLLYESLVSLTAVLPPNEADHYLQSILNPILTLMSTLPAVADQAAFNTAICGSTSAARDARSSLLGCLTTIAATFRRCQVTPFVMEKATQLMPMVSSLIARIHGVRKADLPKEFREIVELDGAEKGLFLPGQPRRSEAHLSGPVRSAKGIFTTMRISVYQVFGSLSGILPTEQFGTVLTAIAVNTNLPTHIIRSLTDKCLFPIGRQHPVLMISILQILHQLFSGRIAFVQSQQQASVPNDQRGGRRAAENEEVVESKQWMYLAKDVSTFLRSQVLDSQKWRGDEALLRATAEVGLCIFESDSDTRGMQHFLFSILNLTADPADGPAIVSMLSEIHNLVFARLLRYALYTPGTRLPPRERDTTMYLLTEPYMKLYPNLASSLVMAGIPSNDLDILNGRILVSNSLNLQRRTIKDFFLEHVPK